VKQIGKVHGEDTDNDVYKTTFIVSLMFLLMYSKRDKEGEKERERWKQRKTVEARQARKTLCSCQIVDEMKVTKAVMQN
jgi:hypothetical protein